MAMLRQFLLLVWKNFILQKRRPIATFFELALPLLFSALLVVIRSTVYTTVIDESTEWSAFSVNGLPSFQRSVLPASNTFKVGYAPSNDSIVRDIMNNFDVFMRNTKSDVEIACPGYTLATSGQLTQLRSNFTAPGGAGGRPGSNAGATTTAAPLIGPGFPGSGLGAATPTAPSMAPGFPGSGLGAATPTAPSMANMLLQEFPESLQAFIRQKAIDANQTTDVYVTNLYNELGPNAFFSSVVQDFTNAAMECAADFIGLAYMPLASRPMSSNNNSGGSPTSNGTGSSQWQGSQVTPQVQVMGFTDESAFIDYVSNDTNLAATLGGVIFTRYSNGSEPNFSYKIRLHSDPMNVRPRDEARFSGNPDTWRTTDLFPTYQSPKPRVANDIYGGKPNYYKEGFLSIMRAVDMSILATLGNTSVSDLANLNLRLKRFPYPPYIDDGFLIAITAVLPLMLMLSFFYTALIIVKSIVHEKETRLKEYLMMTGLSNWLHWSAWFVKYMIFLTISCILIAILYKIPTARGTVLTYSDGSVLFVYLLSFAAATICFCFMVSVFFKKANVAAAAGGVLYGLSYMPYIFIAGRYGVMSWSVKALSCLLSNIAMANGANVLSMYEGTGVGVQWWNLNTPVTVDDDFTMFHSLLFLWIDAVLYMVIAWYVEGVRPGEYGIPKPWYFPCTESYWFGSSTEDSMDDSLDDLHPVRQINCETKTSEDAEFFESEIPGLEKIVEICGLRKVFNPGPNEKVAVDSLDLNMYEGQITVLLGHNGAGKTTTMSMLTGLFPPTSGFANVMGHDITTDIDLARQSMGLCPQHDILYDQLTVEEHLYFFSRLKGLTSSEAEQECKNMLAVLQLTDKHNALASTLSGGMKRKLSVGIALCAGSKFIVLDEPTAGMDPAARRAIWDILQQYRNQCSMLLSTHFMDEADLLGDRIAIMADGKLRCAGSSAFLKNKFGVGYHVVMNKSPNCDIDKLTNIFKSHVPESRLERTAGAEVSYLLPFESSHLFQQLFCNLDDEMDSLGILSYGASITTMEEVFLTVTEDVQKSVSVISKKHSSVLHDMKPQESPSVTAADVLEPPGDSLTGVALWLQQFKALFLKRILHTRRHLKVSISQLLVPVVFVIIAVLNAKYAPFLEKNIERHLTLDAYGDPNYVNYNRTLDVETLAQIYNDQFSGIAHPKLQQGDLSQFLSDEYDEQGGGFNSRNVIAASLRKNYSDITDVRNSTVAWFNAQAYHTSANTLLYADQAFMRWGLNSSNLTLDVSNHPLPRKASARVQEQLLGSVAGFMMAFNVVLGFAFLSASFSIFIIRERTDRASLLQSLAGVDPFCFWLSGFAWDFINFMIPCLCCLIVFAAFDVVEFLRNGQVWITLLLFALYAWSSLPFTYLLSFLFSLPTTGLVSITMFGAILGLATVVTINVLMLIDDQTREIGDTLDWVFLVLPQYCIGQGLSDLYANDKMVNACTSSSLMEEICESFNITYQTDYLAWERYGVGRFIVFMLLEGMLFFAILFAIEYDVQSLVYRIKRRYHKKVNPFSMSEEREGILIDDDVLKEQNRIIDTARQSLNQSDLIYSKRLRKEYNIKKNGKSRSVVAVEDMSFGITRGECFGLLGINGAGKTTTFKMLTGDIRPTSGTACISGQDIVTSRKLAQQNIGYCPQFDGLIEQMTGWETLAMYARLRGVRERYIPKIIERLSRLLHFEEHINKVCGNYSGGNKRKLSTAIALVGGPAVVLLDEPSTGMDPGARRKLWDTISQICTNKRCIILTSHSMEECEALCTRLAIMVNGQLKCIGGCQHLKTKFGQGYSVEVKLARIDCDAAPVKLFMTNNFPGTVVKDEHQGMVSFQVPKHQPAGGNLTLATIFGSMEQAKQVFELRDYSVSQTTLEQVFLSFARRQRESQDP